MLELLVSKSPGLCAGVFPAVFAPEVMDGRFRDFVDEVDE